MIRHPIDLGFDLACDWSGFAAGRTVRGQVDDIVGHGGRAAQVCQDALHSLSNAFPSKLIVLDDHVTASFDIPKDDDGETNCPYPKRPENFA